MSTDQVQVFVKVVQISSINTNLNSTYLCPSSVTYGRKKTANGVKSNRPKVGRKGLKLIFGQCHFDVGPFTLSIWLIDFFILNTDFTWYFWSHTRKYLLLSCVALAQTLCWWGNHRKDKRKCQIEAFSGCFPIPYWKEMSQQRSISLK